MTSINKDTHNTDKDKDKVNIFNEMVDNYTRVYYNTGSNVPEGKHNIAIQSHTLGIRFTMYITGRKLALPKEELDKLVRSHQRSLYNFCCYVRNVHDFTLHLPTSIDIEERDGVKFIKFTKPEFNRNTSIMLPYAKREDMLGVICDSLNIAILKPALRVIRRKFRDRLYSIIRERGYADLYDERMDMDRKNYIINEDDIEFILSKLDSHAHN